MSVPHPSCFLAFPMYKSLLVIKVLTCGWGGETAHTPAAPAPVHHTLSETCHLDCRSLCFPAQVIGTGMSNATGLPMPAPLGFLPVTNRGDNAPCNTLFIGNLSDQVRNQGVARSLYMSLFINWPSSGRCFLIKRAVHAAKPWPLGICLCQVAAGAYEAKDEPPAWACSTLHWKSSGRVGVNWQAASSRNPVVIDPLTCLHT